MGPGGSYLALDHTFDIATWRPTIEEICRRSAGNPLYLLELVNGVEAVRKALVTEGIDAARIETAWIGRNDYVGDNRTEATRRLNRRVEIVVGELGRYGEGFLDVTPIRRQGGRDLGRRSGGGDIRRRVAASTRAGGQHEDDEDRKEGEVPGHGAGRYPSTPDSGPGHAAPCR